MAKLLFSIIFFLVGSPLVCMGADFGIKEKGSVNYLEENGMPYFGSFLSTNRNEIDLAGTWKFMPDADNQGEGREYFQTWFNDSDWRKISVPFDFTKLKDLSSYQGPVWYRTTVSVPAEWEKRFNRLELDGVAQKCKIWINGRLVGEHNGGFTRFSFNISPFLRYGAHNQITIQVDNRRTYTDVPPMLYKTDRLGWWEYGGICREVKLISSLPQTLVKIEVTAEPAENGAGNLALKGLVLNAGPEAAGLIAEVSLKDEQAGKVLYQEVRAPIVAEKGELQSFSFSTQVKEIKSWSPDAPNLYTLTLKVEGPFGSESNSLPIGFRKFEIRGDKFFLNGKRYYMRGINRHEDDPETGFYQSDARLAEDMSMLKELHVNHMRPAHYPNDPRWLYLCDREGITLTEEIPLYQAGTGVEKRLEAVFSRDRKSGSPDQWKGASLKQIQDPELVSNARLQLAEMIERDRNHPSVIVWSLGNENLTIITSVARKTYKELYRLSKKLSPERPVTFELLSGPVVSPAFERTGDIADIISVNEYYGWYFGKVEQAGAFFDAVHRKYPNKPIIVSEFGADTLYGRHDSGVPQKLSEEYQVKILMETWQQMLDRDFISGGMPWIFADFRCAWWGPEAAAPNMNLKGLMDYSRHKKMAFGKIQELYANIAEQKTGPLLK